MKYVRVTSTPDSERAPELTNLLAGSTYVTEARLYDWNISPGDRPTVLLEVDGDIALVRNEIVGLPGVRTADATPVTDDRFTLLIVLEPTEVPVLKNVLGTLTREGVVIAKPVVYRDGRIHARIVGSASVLQTAISDLPSEGGFEIASIGDFDRGREAPLSTLSDRQREAVLAAADLGYYEHPRQATHTDVAARLDCAPNTASEHLQKAEAKIVRAAMTVPVDR